MHQSFTAARFGLARALTEHANPARPSISNGWQQEFYLNADTELLSIESGHGSDDASHRYHKLAVDRCRLSRSESRH